MKETKEFFLNINASRSVIDQTSYMHITTRFTCAAGWSVSDYDLPAKWQGLSKIFMRAQTDDTREDKSFYAYRAKAEVTTDNPCNLMTIAKSLTRLNAGLEKLDDIEPINSGSRSGCIIDDRVMDYLSRIARITGAKLLMDEERDQQRIRWSLKEKIAQFRKDTEKLAEA